jgi:translocation and assembly module TamB
VQVNFANGGYKLAAGILLPDQGSASASVELSPEKQLGGNLMLDFSQLAWLEAWIPSLRDIQGELHAEMNLSGTLEQPQWLGSARIDQASATVPALGLDLKKLTLALEAGDGNQVSIEGSAQSGPGHILLDGQINKTPAQLWRLSLGIKGERFEVVNTPEAHVLATPKLNVDASRKLVNIEGSILLPEVDIRLQNLPARAVKVSDDAVIVNESEAEFESTNGIPVKTNIKLILGEKVHFNGFGFEAKLSGSLDLVEEPGQPTLAYGALAIDEGRYKAYGQNLSVERGRLIFQGPYDNPGLDIRAVRKTPDVTVGLDIGGTLKDIRSTVFSEPSLPDSEAVAILLTGKPLSDTNKSEANILVNAIASLGIKKSRTLTSQLSETFGLDVLTIESDSGLEQSSLTIGKYLTPRLYVRYAIGLFDQLSKLALEYRLTEHLMVEAKSGKDQSMDIIYRIER